MSMRSLTTVVIVILSLAGYGLSVAQETPNLGRPATPDAIAELDIDVMPDGTGLPPGSGTAADGARTWGRACRGCHGPAGETVPVVQILRRVVAHLDIELAQGLLHVSPVV